jgi:thiamine biosynthesis protein ThiS
VSNFTEIRVTVNGQQCIATDGQSIMDLLRSLGIDPQRVAVEMDRKIVKSADWSTTTLKPGTCLEIVQFVGGG